MKSSVLFDCFFMKLRFLQEEGHALFALAQYDIIQRRTQPVHPQDLGRANGGDADKICRKRRSVIARFAKDDYDNYRDDKRVEYNGENSAQRDTYRGFFEKNTDYVGAKRRQKRGERADNDVKDAVCGNQVGQRATDE